MPGEPATTLRPETADDVDAIRDLVAEAFAAVPYGDGTESAIVDRLRERGELTISLVAERAGRVVGHAAASPVRLSGGEPGWFGLGPVAVLPGHQRTGVGTALVARTLDLLRERTGAAGVVVLGDPGYYGRFGFRAGAGLTCDGVPATHFQSVPLSVDGRVPRAAVAFSPAFDA